MSPQVVQVTMCGSRVEEEDTHVTEILSEIVSKDLPFVGQEDKIAPWILKVQEEGAQVALRGGPGETPKWVVIYKDG